MEQVRPANCVRLVAPDAIPGLLTGDELQQCDSPTRLQVGKAAEKAADTFSVTMLA